MTVICIGPVCVPLYSIIPFFLLLIRRIWAWLKGEKGEEGERTGSKNDNDEAGCPLVDVSVSIPSKLRRRKLGGDDAVAEGSVTAEAAGLISMKSSGDLELIKARCAKERKVAVVIFTAKWCKPCKRIYPVFESESLRPEVACRALFVLVDIDELTDLALDMGVGPIPAVHILNYPPGPTANWKVEKLCPVTESSFRAALSSQLGLAE